MQFYNLITINLTILFFVNYTLPIALTIIFATSVIHYCVFSCTKLYAYMHVLRFCDYYTLAFACKYEFHMLQQRQLKAYLT